MDKETLSHYGWIVVLILILSVMIALASPFGNFIKTAIWNTTTALVDMSNEGFDIIGGGNGGNTGDTGDTDGDTGTGGEIECDHSTTYTFYIGGTYTHGTMCEICYADLGTEACTPYETTGDLFTDYHCSICYADLITTEIFNDSDGKCEFISFESLPEIKELFNTVRWTLNDTYTETGLTADFSEYLTPPETYKLTVEFLDTSGNVMRRVEINPDDTNTETDGDIVVDDDVSLMMMYLLRANNTTARTKKDMRENTSYLFSYLLKKQVFHGIIS